MGLWAGGTSVNSTATAMVFNQLFNKKALSIVRKKNGLLYAALGKEEPLSMPNEGTKFRGEKKITGLKVEVKLHGKLKTISTVSDGANEVATATLSVDGAEWGGAEFDLAHYADNHAIPMSQMDRFAGDESKTLDFISEVFEHLMLSYENTLGTALHTSSAPSRTVFGGWEYAVADDNTYGGIDRTDSANADFRAGYLNASTGALTLAKIATAQNTIVGNGGTPDVGVCGIAIYGKLQQLVQSYTHIVGDKDWDAFGGTWVRYGPTRFILDQRTSSGVMGILDSSSWVLYRNDGNFTRSGIVVDPSRVATYVLPWGSWAQLICLKPNSNAKLSGIDS